MTNKLVVSVLLDTINKLIHRQVTVFSGDMRKCRDVGGESGPLPRIILMGVWCMTYSQETN